MRRHSWMPFVALSCLGPKILSGADEDPVRIHFQTSVSRGDVFDPVKVETPVLSNQAFPLHIQWSRELSRDIIFAFSQNERVSPFRSAGALWVGSSRTSDILALDPNNGQIIRVLPKVGPLETQPVQVGDQGDWIIGSANGTLSRIDQDGKVRWNYASTGPIFSAIQQSGEFVFFHAVDGALMALDISTGEVRWSHFRESFNPTGMPIFGTGAPAIVGDIVIAGFSDGVAVGLRLTDGSRVWEREVAPDRRWNDADGTVLPVDEQHAIIASYSGPILCVKVETGEPVWQLDIGSSDDIASDDTWLYLPSSDGSITALEKVTGQVKWKWIPEKMASVSTPVVWRDHLIVATGDGRLLTIKKATGDLVWSMKFPHIIQGFSTPPGYDQSALYAISDGGWIYALVADDFQATPLKTDRAKWNILQ